MFRVKLHFDLVLVSAQCVSPHPFVYSSVALLELSNSIGEIPLDSAVHCSAVRKHVCWGQCPHVQLLAVSNSMNILRNLYVGFAHFYVHVLSACILISRMYLYPKAKHICVHAGYICICV